MGKNFLAWFPTILAPEILARVISARMFHHKNIWHCRLSGRWTFQLGNVSIWGLFGTGNFWYYGNFGTGYFGTWTFRHMDILAPCKAIWTFLCRHFGTCATVPKCSYAEMSSCRNFPVPKIPCVKNFSCRKVPLSKRSCVEMSICLKVHVPKCSCDEKSVLKWLAKISGAKMVHVDSKSWIKWSFVFF